MNRNKTVDAIRGLAMLMVVLGHTITGVTTNYEHTFLFQVIWTLQMPLFIIISGYVTRYGKPIESAGSLWRFIKKRTLAYMLPWLMWTIVVRGLIFGQSVYLDLRHILWHMDSGYWFLATIWTISLIFGFADYICNKITKSFAPSYIKVSLHLLGAIIGMTLIGLVGWNLGLNFFAIKLTLYYLPFYLIGYMYGQFQDSMNKHKGLIKTEAIAIAICMGVWISLINRIDFYSGSDSLIFAVLRFFTSLMGCVALIGLFSGIDIKLGGVFYVGKTLARDIHHPLSMPESDNARSSTKHGRRNGSDYDSDKLCYNTINRCNDNMPNFQKSNSQQAVVLQEQEKWLTSFLQWCGINSLAIYLLHGFFLNLLKFELNYPYHTVRAQLLTAVDFSITVTLCVFTIQFLYKNNILSKFLFWK